MSDLISRQLAVNTIKAYCVTLIEKGIHEIDVVDYNVELQNEIKEVRGISTKEYELRLLKNYIDNMPKTYRKRNANWVIVRDLLMEGTSHSGRTSSIKKCFELGIDAYDYDLIVKGGGIND